MELTYCRCIVPLAGSGHETIVTSRCMLHDKPGAAETIREFEAARLRGIAADIGKRDAIEPEEIEVLRYAFDGHAEDALGEIWVRNRNLLPNFAPNSDAERITKFFSIARREAEKYPVESADDDYLLDFKPARFSSVVNSLFTIPWNWELESVTQVLLREDELRPEGGYWADYRAVGIGESHVPELIWMVKALDFQTEQWNIYREPAAYHAVRALAQIGSPEAAAFLLSQIEIDLFDLHEDSMEVDHTLGEIWSALAVIGTPVLEPVVRLLHNATASGVARENAAQVLWRLAITHPRHRDRVIRELVAALDGPVEVGGGSHSCFASALVHMKAIEAADAIRRCFEDGRLDPWEIGSWERVQEDLGLLPSRPVRPPGA